MDTESVDLARPGRNRRGGRVSIDAELLLPTEVEIFSVRDLPPNIRVGIEAVDEDYALTRGRSRAPSRIIDKDSADLLRVFRTPVRIVDAVLSFAGRRGLDPEKTLEEAYPLLFRLYQNKLLVPAESAIAVEGDLDLGSELNGFQLIRRVQALDDNEVFLARNAAGRFAAIKFYRKANERVVQALEREAAILQRAPCGRAPEYLFVTRSGSGVALATEWVFGSDALNAAAAIRGLREVRSDHRLLTLCSEIATAFAELHEAGVLHGDVHPRNVLIDGRGLAHLIDFGLAQSLDRSVPTVERGGIAFYFEPEFADAQRHRNTAPLSAGGEQYSVASLLYQLWTGVYYLDWSLEREAMLRQIVEEDPVRFDKRDIAPWPALEEVLRCSLNKRPERRFASMRELSEALRSLLADAQSRDQKATAHRRERAREKELLDRALSRYALGADGLRDGPANTPVASINYGAGGVAYGIYRIALRRGDARMLALADVWTQKAFALSSHEKAFYDSHLEINTKTVGETSLFHSATGLYCVRALVSIAVGDVDGASRAIDMFIVFSRRPCDKLDLTLGKASLLLGCAELIEALPTEWSVTLRSVRERGQEIADELISFLPSEPAATSPSIRMLGIAHGWGGLIFALLRWSRATQQEVSPIVLEKLEELETLAEPHGAGVRWPVYNGGSRSFMDGWCNGTAGYVMLFALASRISRKERFAELAERACTGAWMAEMRVGTLCCGLAGISYALAAVHRLTGSQLWLERARGAARRAAGDNSQHFFRDSLYKGAVGVAVLADDLEQPEAAAMPLFEPRC
jgi:serine/threonine protein kinase